jgi:hypothetical protein
VRWSGFARSILGAIAARTDRVELVDAYRQAGGGPLGWKVQSELPSPCGPCAPPEVAQPAASPAEGRWRARTVWMVSASSGRLSGR